MTRPAVLDRLTVLAATLRESDPEAATLLMALIAQAQAPKPRAGRVRTTRVRHAGTGEWLDVPETMIDGAVTNERNERTK